ncbi:MAG: sulfite:cytochrome C oxidoreductase subunit B [Sulfurovum sp.]|nr:sulfite:cytochrome C oxidoreductase subunit B [Sulfurovum sp.]
MKRVLLTLLLIQGLAVAAETKVDKGIKMPYMEFPMKPGKGMYSTKGKCNMCHSWGYTINQGLQSKKFWRKKVVKMITVFHAPIKNEDIEEVVEYLYANYGNGKEE